MKIIGYIIQKEFRQIFRNKGMLPIIFIMPLIQLLILSNAATFDVKNISFSYVDNDKSSASRELIDEFVASPYFRVTESFPSINTANEALKSGKADILLAIPEHFERSMVNDSKTTLAVYTNAIDGAQAALENVYVQQIIQNFNTHAAVEIIGRGWQNPEPANIDQESIDPLEYPFHNSSPEKINVLTIPSFWYNSTLNYKTFMVPGILVLLVTMLSLFLSGMNIVREKEIGTLEQINVTPVRKYQFIVGKLFPFWVLGLGILTLGLLIARLIFDVPMLGSIALIYLFTSIYLLVILGMGLLISNYTDTQQQAMFIAWFFMVIFILMSGLFTPIESMPTWAQALTLVNPIRYFVETIRLVMLKGSGFTDILPHLAIITFYAVGMNVLAVSSYKKRN